MPEHVVWNRGESDEPDLIGRQIEGYLIKHELGRGGMGIVYLAQDVELGRPIALKLLKHTWGTNEDFKTRFVKEARILARLNHRNIVSVMQWLDTSFGQAMVMEYVDGVNLNFIIASPTVSYPDKLAIFKQVLDGVGYAHECGVVHRDLKPDNILIDRSRTVKITDFGLARLNESGGITTYGMVAGSPPYMSPEHFDTLTSVDERSDVWSLGVVLYELLFGSRPFKSSDVQALQQGIHLPPLAPPPDVQNEMPEGIWYLLEKSLKYDRSERFENARAFLDTLIDLEKNGWKSTGVGNPVQEQKPGPGLHPNPVQVGKKTGFLEAVETTGVSGRTNGPDKPGSVVGTGIKIKSRPVLWMALVAVLAPVLVYAISSSPFSSRENKVPDATGPDTTEVQDVVSLSTDTIPSNAPVHVARPDSGVTSEPERTAETVRETGTITEIETVREAENAPETEDVRETGSTPEEEKPPVDTVDTKETPDYSY